MACFGFILYPFRTVEYKSERYLFYIFMHLKWHYITLTLCSFMSHTHAITLHCKPNKNEREISQWRLLYGWSEMERAMAISKV